MAGLTIPLGNANNSVVADHTQSVSREVERSKSSDRTFYPGAVNQNESGWTSATYSSTKVAIDMVKESSDVFPPLKSVAGGLAVILKHYDV